MLNTIKTHDALAKRLLAARRGAPKISALELGGFPASAKDAYATQVCVTDAIGYVGAFKTARKPGKPDQIPAPIYRDLVHKSPAIFTADEISLIGIELELAFHINSPLPDADDPEFAELVKERVSPVAVIEVCDTRLADLEIATPLQKLADNQINGGLVVSEPLTDWLDLNLSVLRAKMTFGTDVVVDGPVSVPGGDAFETFLGLARQIGNHCGGLQPGQYVITGSVNGLPFIERGTSVYARIEGLGELNVDFPL
ncbi:MAG: 2-keto-4-pentenoate hydratase [Paracoccaceae bacterium]